MHNLHGKYFIWIYFYKIRAMNTLLNEPGIWGTMRSESRKYNKWNKKKKKNHFSHTHKRTHYITLHLEYKCDVVPRPCFYYFGINRARSNLTDRRSFLNLFCEDNVWMNEAKIYFIDGELNLQTTYSYLVIHRGWWILRFMWRAKAKQMIIECIWRI